ncbi:MAG: glycoside hydrolase family 127 protein [Firmicutes bacterium]|nr:glycoside hydrolase family 127 protein [Bacillota bacterium]
MALKTITPVPLNHAHLDSGFWQIWRDRVRTHTIAYQWQALNDAIPGAEPSYAIENWRIVAGEQSGEHHGFVFQDSDLFKWLEAVGLFLQDQPDLALEAKADGVIDLLARAQAPDGYLNSFYQLHPSRPRWSNLRDDHELYCAGHLMEAAVAYQAATGKTTLLDIACRLGDHLCRHFGPAPDQVRGYSGHPEVELALVKLYRATGERRYLDLARFFVEERGKSPLFFSQEAALRGDQNPFNPSYFQAHAPLSDQAEARGHAVRAMYLFSGATDVAVESEDETERTSLMTALVRLWQNVTQRRMYVTGGVGSSAYGEAFTIDYDLPSDRAYTETCAAIGLVFWSQRMLALEGQGQYADILERALYNGVLSGISTSGDRFFYVNPLEVWPEAVAARHDLHAVKVERQPWFGCACCPPNLARLLADLPKYLYGTLDDQLFVHLYAASEVRTVVAGTPVIVRQDTEYPWEDRIDFTVSPEDERTFTLRLRIPDWAEAMEVSINGQVTDGPITDGYLALTRRWRPGDRVRLVLPMLVRPIYAHPGVRSIGAEVALARGPIVYCFESVDNGSNLGALFVDSTPSHWVAEWEDDIAGGVVALKGPGQRATPQAGDPLYHHQPWPVEDTRLRAIPYYAWGNRGVGEMRVWMHIGHVQGS